MRASLPLLLVTSCSAQTEEAKPLFPCTKLLDKPYGICSHLTQPFWDQPYQDSLLQKANKIGINNVRFDLWMPYAEKIKGHQLLDVTHSAVMKNMQAGMSQLGILFVGWKGQRAWQKQKEYYQFLDTLLTQYSEKIPYWEVMNEVNLTANGDKVPLDSVIKSYMSLLPYTYKKIKEANSHNLVTSSGISEISDGFLELMCKNRSYQYFDILNFHSYDTPEFFVSKFRKIRSMMDKFGWEKPVWITECGYSTYVEKSIKVWAHDVKEKEKIQANWIPRMYLIAFAYGVDKVFTYSFRSRENNDYEIEDHFGLLHADLSPKPAYYTYKTMTRMCPDKSTRPKLLCIDGVYMASWKRPDGKKIWALWTSKGERTIKLRYKGTCSCYNDMGEEIKLSLVDFKVTPSVIYIVGAKTISFIK